MRESWESGDFWIAYVGRRSVAIDAIYWHKIDQRFFGPTDNVEDAWRQRLDLLSDKEKEEMELLVAKKVKEMESRVLVWDPDEYTLCHIDIAKTHAAEQEKKAEEQKEEKEKGKKDHPKAEDNKVVVHAVEASPSGLDVEQIVEKLAELSA
ncbi:Aminoglycoside phosphotransferase [Penicillium expansum]|nr:Aminoglycoside phosphotransferase [Penicillium expansum]